MRRQARKPGVLVATALLTIIMIAASVANAQQSEKIHRIGIIAGSPPRGVWRQIPAYQGLLKGLEDLGYKEGQNIVIEFRSAEGHYERLPEIAAELVGLNVDVLVPGVCGPVLNAAKQATMTIPIVVPVCSDDIVATGVVASLARPGGNITGLSKLTPELASKRLEMLKEMLPKTSRVAVLWDPSYLAVAADWQKLRATAHTLNVTILPVEARGPDDFETAFTAMVRERAEAVITLSDTMTYNAPKQIAELALRSGLPLISPFRETTEVGGVLSYGPNLSDMYQRAAGYVDRILKGAKPADLPIEQPTKFELLINLRTAKALGFTIPGALLSRADEVIE